VKYVAVTALIHTRKLQDEVSSSDDGLDKGIAEQLGRSRQDISSALAADAESQAFFPCRAKTRVNSAHVTAVPHITPLLTFDRVRDR